MSQPVHRSSQWLTAEQSSREYRAEAEQLHLGGNWAWPARPVREHGPGGEAVRYEKGYGKASAQFFWYCSWATRTVDDALPIEARRAALTKALKLRHMYYYRVTLDDRNKRHVDEILDAARAGQMRPMAQDVGVNCADL